MIIILSTVFCRSFQMAYLSTSGESNTCAAILTISRAELQQLNFDRIFPKLEENGVLTKGVTNVLRSKSASEKSNVLKNVLQAKDEKNFQLFLEIVMTEDDDNFFEPTSEFLAMVSNFPKYEDCYHSFRSKLSGLSSEEAKTIDYSFVQIGKDNIFTVGGDGKTHYDSVHGVTLHFPSNSLPSGVEQATVTVKVGFSYHNLSANMVTCSATVTLQCAPQVVFTKDVFLKIPHSSSSASSNDLCFVKFKDDTDYGEVYNGIFPEDYPYGVVTMRSFSSYVIVRGKRCLNHSTLKRTRLQWSKRKWVHAMNKKRKVISHISSYSDGCLCKPSSTSFWLCVSKISVSSEIKKFLCVVSQCTPTGFQAVKQYYSGHAREHCMSFSFDSDWLVFHPQSAHDCGWSAMIDGYYKISKNQAERLCDSNGTLNIPVIQYILTPDQQHFELYMPKVTVNASGADRRLSFDLTLRAAGTESGYKCKLLQCLSTHPVMEDNFLQQLAYQLPVWQPVAQMLGLTASDIEHIEYDFPNGRGEKAYRAFLQWMQKEGYYGATYDVLLQALCQAKDLKDCRSITDAWWYSHQYLSNIADQPIDMMCD